MKPIKNSLIIEVLEPNKADEGKTNSGIILTNQENKTDKAKVISVGQDVKEVKIGDEVFFTKDFAQTLEIEGEKITFIREIDVICIKE